MNHHDEGYAALMNFINNPSEDLDQRAKDGEVAIQVAIGRLNQLSGQEGLTSHALGGVIHRLRHKETWRKCEGMGEEWMEFSHFCKNKLGMSIAKANTLERIWERSGDIGLTPEEIETLGWPVTQSLIRVAHSRRDVDHWLGEFKKSGNRREFVENIKAHIVTTQQESTEETVGGEERHKELPRFRRFRFSGKEDEFLTETFEKIAKRVGKELGKSISENECLLLILTEWLSLKST